MNTLSHDADPDETDEWLRSLDAVAKHVSPGRARELLHRLERHARDTGIALGVVPYRPYRNTISLEEQPPYPGDLVLETRIASIIRWNALAMVVRANMAYGELGGHIASFASAAEIFETGFNHFFVGPDQALGDLVFFQPHSAPGVYARAYLEGRLSEAQLLNFRRESGGQGLCSYPHPYLMPEFWQFPTGSMGIGPINAVYQARFMRYLQHRAFRDTSGRHVWGVFGDGEMDEPEALAGLSLAAREGLDNLTFIINCNLQRLDGPVRGNGQIIQELERTFQGMGWNVIKVLWGSEWDAIFARDRAHALLRRFSETVDGKYQTLGAMDGSYNLVHFFEQDPQTRALVQHMSPEEVDGLKRGGHDFKKLYAALAAARAHRGQPTVVLAKTKKGYGMGQAGESRMTSHQTKKLDVEALLAFRDRFELPLSDAQAAALEFYRPAEDSAEVQYLKARRAALGGVLPARRQSSSQRLALPALHSYGSFALRASNRTMSTTVALVRLLSNLIRDKVLGSRVVPIVADEARTFGMASLFRQIGIYSPHGQLYEPEDAGTVLTYRESTDGQLLEEGINEAGAISSWVAAATAYSVHDEPMLPFYIFYSMFGFQRIGDLIWAAADQRARGFLIGATAGKTTLGGEGLQHQDGSSHLIASTVPNCRAYDPAFAYELAVILDHGLHSMLEQERDEFYYITVMNETYQQPDMPEGVEDDIVKGLYRLQTSSEGPAQVRLLGAGALLREAIAAAALLESDWQVKVDVFSVTSFSELARQAQDIERRTLFNGETHRPSHVASQLPGKAPIVAVTDYVRAVPQMIAPFVRGRFVALGTDGFGRSDTREALRRFFEVSRYHIAVSALCCLVDEGSLPAAVVHRARQRYDLLLQQEPGGDS